ASLGALNVDEAIRLHNALVEIAAASLPKPKPLDPRIADVIRRIHASPRAALGELAQASNLSYHRMSHLFTTNMGISVRSYQLWYKIDLAWRLILEGHKLADIAAMSGFCDAAHMCHIFQDAFGVPISYHLEKMKIRVRYAEAQPQIS
ncbi:MAG TPA: AraC family transcriptional regulator, partial [Steroidobacteraceae bacterium]|nr:AraC family transcriptional regulator [Steroidobacteraceae bacterium]